MDKVEVTVFVDHERPARPAAIRPVLKMDGQPAIELRGVVEVSSSQVVNEVPTVTITFLGTVRYEDG